MAKKDYDKTLTRLIGILTKISHGDCLNAKEFAVEYNVSTRTIQKDIYDRLNSFPIEKNCDGKFRFIDGFSLDKSMLGADEMILLSLSLSQFDSSKHFSDTGNTILNKLLYPKFFNPYYINQNYLEPITTNQKVHDKLMRVIKEQHIVNITFEDTTVRVEPYKLTNFDGFWYLFAKDIDADKIKTYMLYRINKVEDLCVRHNTPHHKIDAILENVHSSWFEDGEAWEVVVKVNANISHYFKRRKFLQSQKILEEFDDGSLQISFEISHDEDVDNIIKSWLPDIYVEKPKKYKDQIKIELEEYLRSID